jgi:hypothetical protein
MPKLTVTIKINNELVELKPDLYKGSDLRALTTIDCGKRLYLDLKGDVDVPVLEKDLIQIKGDFCRRFEYT